MKGITDSQIFTRKHDLILILLLSLKRRSKTSKL